VLGVSLGGEICAHSVAVGLGYLNPPAAAVAAPNEPTMPEAPAGPQFVAADSADAAPNDTAIVILPPNFASAWQKGQIMIVVEAEVSRKPHTRLRAREEEYVLQSTTPISC